MKSKKQRLFCEETPRGSLEVWQDGSIRSLHIKNKKAVQSQLDMENKEKLLLQHSRAMMSFLLFRDPPQSVLLLGLGGGSIIHFLTHWFPFLKITVVDFNKKLIDVGKQYFGLPITPQVSIEISDAFDYLKKTKQKNLNVILVDLHDGECLPDFLYDPDFMSHCFHRLSPGGMLVINLLIKKEQDFTDILIVLRQFFTDVNFCITFKNQQNILLFAFKSPSLLDFSQLKSRASQCQKKYSIEFEEFVDGIIKIDPP